jgi:hypothetical protein
MFHLDHNVLNRQKAPDRRYEENPHIDRKANVPQNRAQRRAIAEIGEDIGNPYDQEQNRQFIDQALRAGVEFRQQHRGGEERKGLDAVEMRAERARGNGIVIERGVARFGIVEAAKADRLHRRNRQQIEYDRSKNTPFGDRHGSPRRAAMNDSIEPGIILTRMVQRAKPRAS